jgi:hypothetical protein
MRQLIIYVIFGYIGLLATAFAVMLIHTTFLTSMLPILLTMPWSGWMGLYLQQYSFITEPTNPLLAEATLVASILGCGLLNIAILFGISRCFKKAT